MVFESKLYLKTIELSFELPVSKKNKKKIVRLGQM
jgi:hypothetical protein